MRDSASAGSDRERQCSAGVTPDEARKLVLWKAKQFGLKTAMYQVVDLALYKGKQILLEWVED
jgi:hypothetical protein